MDRAGEKETYPNYTSGLSREEDWARLSPSSFLGDREEVQCSLSVEAGGNSHKCVGCVDVGPKKKEGEGRAQSPSRESPFMQLG